ncbi:hypothetical protein HGB07_08550 [Candidatus Roizmanbacteria bacterium]|nr:hypothetical protein [Candidatus Roizmanbacteria bacterium]
MKKSLITYDDFDKLDIRIGEIKEAAPVEKSTKLLSLMVDFGEDYGVVEILSGIAQYYTPDELVGKKIPFIANLEPRKMMGKFSNGMIMCADTEEKPTLFDIVSGVPNGTIVR